MLGLQRMQAAIIAAICLAGCGCGRSDGPSRVAVGGQAWPLKGWLVVGVWSVVLGALAARAYRRDTQRS